MTDSGSTPTYILGVSAFYHDAAAALLRDGVVVAAAQEERFTRRKGDSSFPHQAIAYCLETAQIDVDRIDHMVFYEKPWLHFERLLESHLCSAPLGLRAFLAAMPSWLNKKLFLRRAIRRELKSRVPILFCEHHESHMAAAFYPSPFEEAAILTVDGVGEWATTSFGQGQGREFEVLGELHFPHSVGLLYSAFTAYLGFRVNNGEYKVMGLAPYGEPVYADRIMEELIDLRPDGSFRLNMRYFDYMRNLRMTNRHFEALFDGPARIPETEISVRHMNVARSLQVVTEEILLRMARHVHDQTKQRHLVLGGGVALNCVANGRILREGPFDDIWIQPAAGDAGSALGAALAVWHRYLEQPRKVTVDQDGQRGSLLGPSFSSGEIREFLDAEAVPYRESSTDELPGAVAGHIADGRVVGFFQGRMEFGPRALGCRSILADARSPEMQRTLNLKIKKRESFRPFAPAVLREKVSEWFDLDKASPYMLLVTDVADKQMIAPSDSEVEGFARLQVARSTIPAVTHVDGSARIQTVERDTNPLFFDVLQAFQQRTGCGVLVNTSFNVRGEPIVCTPAEAYSCFMKTAMDVLVMENFVIQKAELSQVES